MEEVPSSPEDLGDVIALYASALPQVQAPSASAQLCLFLGYQLWIWELAGHGDHRRIWPQFT
jgi:hypothetical protein